MVCDRVKRRPARNSAPLNAPAGMKRPSLDFATQLAQPRCDRVIRITEVAVSSGMWHELDIQGFDKGNLRTRAMLFIEAGAQPLNVCAGDDDQEQLVDDVSF